MAEWVSAVMAVLSGAFAAWAWWEATRSTKAKQQAEKAEQRAEQAERRAQEQTESLQRLAAALEQRVAQALPPRLKITPGRRLNSSPRLTNNSQADLEVTELLNRDAFFRIDGMDTPFTLAPGQAREFHPQRVGGKPLPPTLHLRLSDGTELHVHL